MYRSKTLKLIKGKVLFYLRFFRLHIFCWLRDNEKSLIRTIMLLLYMMKPTMSYAREKVRYHLIRNQNLILAFVAWWT